MPAPAGDAVEEAELEKVADAEVGDGAEIGREFVVLRLARIGPDTGLQALNRLLRFAIGVATMLFLPPLRFVIELRAFGLTLPLRRFAPYNGYTCVG